MSELDVTRVEAIAAAREAHHWTRPSGAKSDICVCGIGSYYQHDHVDEELIAANDKWLAEHPDEAPWLHFAEWRYPIRPIKVADAIASRVRLYLVVKP